MKTRPKILIVDDKVENLISLEKILAELDVEFVRADSGNEGLRVTLESDFAIALVDVQMPGMDGFEMVELMRQERKTLHLPVIFVSAIYKEEYHQIKGIETGAVDFITKPIVPKILIGKVRVFIDLHNNKVSLEEEVKRRKGSEKVVRASESKLRKLNKQLEERYNELQASEERFRTLVLTIPDVVYRLDTDGKFTFINDSVQGLGYQTKEIIGEHFCKLILPDDLGAASRSKVLPKYAGRRTGDENAPKLFDERRTGERQTMGLEVRLITKGKGNAVSAVLNAIGDEYIICEVNSSGLYALNPYAKNKVLIGTVGVIRDITSRKLLEKELLETNEVLEIKVKERTAELSRANEVLGVEIAERKRVEKELEKHRDHLEELVGKRTVDLDKRILEVEQLNRGMVNLLEDLRISNENLEIMTKKLAETNNELEAFSYSVSHDLRAPLRAINGFSQMLVEDYGNKLQPEGQRQLGIIQESAQKMGQLIDDLLAFSRLGQKGMSISEIDMSLLAEEVIEQLKLSDSKRDVQFKLGTLPNASGDLAMIRAVFANLLSNALKYTRPNEAAVIEIAGRTDGEEIIYTVKDNGVGFDMKYADKLFRVFQRLHGPEEFEGTGIGLALVQRIITRHGGRVWGEGKVDGGATFYFALPKVET